MTEDKIDELKAKSEALKFMDSMYAIKLVKNIFQVAGAGGYNLIAIENKGDANDTNVVLFIEGIHFADTESKNPNVQWEKDMLKIKVVRPGDKIYLHVWTYETLFKTDSTRVKASSDAGTIAVSVH